MLHFITGMAATLILSGLLYLYGGLLLTEYLKIPAWYSLIAPPVILLVQYFFFPLLLMRIFSEAQWKSLEQEYPAVMDLRQAAGAFPPLGIYPSPWPFICTFGHHRGNCRIIASQGLIDLLTPSEMRLVLAHELYHHRAQDYIILMCTGLIPFSIYMLSRFMLFMGIGVATMRGTRSLSSFGMLLWWIKNQLYTILFFSSRCRESAADRYAAGCAPSPDDYFMVLQKITEGQMNCRDMTIRIEKLSFALNFLSITDPVPAFYRGLVMPNSDTMMPPADDRESSWREYYDLFSSHPHPSIRRGKSHCCSERRREIIVHFLPFTAVIAGSIPLIATGEFLGIPFILGGTALLYTAALHFSSLKGKTVLISDGLAASHEGALTGIPVYGQGMIASSEHLLISPCITTFCSEGIVMPLFARAFYPPETFLPFDDQGMEVKGWLRQDPFFYIEVQEIRKGRNVVYSSVYPLLVKCTAAAGIFFGIFLIMLQYKGG